MRPPLVLDLAAGLIGGVFQLSDQQIRDLSERLLPIEPGFLHVGVGEMAGQIRQHDSPGFRVLPHKGIDAHVLPALGHPDPQNFDRPWIVFRNRWNQ